MNRLTTLCALIQVISPSSELLIRRATNDKVWQGNVKVGGMIIVSADEDSIDLVLETLIQKLEVISTRIQELLAE